MHIQEVRINRNAWEDWEAIIKYKNLLGPDAPINHRYGVRRTGTIYEEFVYRRTGSTGPPPWLYFMELEQNKLCDNCGATINSIPIPSKCEFCGMNNRTPPGKRYLIASMQEGLSILLPGEFDMNEQELHYLLNTPGFTLHGV